MKLYDFLLGELVFTSAEDIPCWRTVEEYDAWSSDPINNKLKRYSDVVGLASELASTKHNHVLLKVFSSTGVLYIKPSYVSRVVDAD